MHLETRLTELAAEQHGVVGIDQANEMGLGWTARAYLIESGRWRQVTSRTLEAAAAPRGRGRSLAVATRHEGSPAVVSHCPGGWWWRLPGFSPVPVTIATTRRHLREPVTWERRIVRSLPDHWVTVLNGIPIVRPELLVMQLCATVHPDRAERALDNAWRFRLLSGRSLVAFLADHAARGRNGIALLRQLVDARGPDYRPPDSGLEGRVTRILEDAGLGFRRQIDLGGEEHWSGRVDFVCESVSLVLEVQSQLHHSALTDRADDAARRAKLESDGFTIVEATDDEVFTQASTVVARVRAAIAAARTAAS